MATVAAPAGAHLIEPTVRDTAAAGGTCGSPLAVEEAAAFGGQQADLAVDDRHAGGPVGGDRGVEAAVIRQPSASTPLGRTTLTATAPPYLAGRHEPSFLPL